jgi:hypothetical protein
MCTVGDMRSAHGSWEQRSTEAVAVVVENKYLAGSGEYDSSTSEYWHWLVSEARMCFEGFVLPDVVTGLDAVVGYAPVLLKI